MESWSRAWRIGGSVYVLAVVALAFMAFLAVPGDAAGWLFTALLVVTLPTGYFAQLPVYFLGWWLAELEGVDPLSSEVTPLGLAAFVVAYGLAAGVNVVLFRCFTAGLGALWRAAIARCCRRQQAV